MKASEDAAYYVNKSATTFDLNTVAITVTYQIEGEDEIEDYFEGWSGKEKFGTWVKLGSDDAQGVAVTEDLVFNVVSVAEAMGDGAFIATAQVVFASALCLAAF